MRAESLRTHFGSFSFEYRPGPKSTVMSPTGSTQPTEGHISRLPVNLVAGVSMDTRKLVPCQDRIWALPREAREITILFRLS
jgi:hypothetical protein